MHTEIIPEDHLCADNKTLSRTRNDLKTDGDAPVKETIINYSTAAVKEKKIFTNLMTRIHFSNLITLFILSLLTWGILWCAWGEGWLWAGVWFRLAATAVVAWTAAYIFTKLTAMPGLLAALFVGILVRYLEYLNMREHEEIDSFLRKIYPVVILGKASLGWDVSFMKEHWKRVLTLGSLPWAAEVLMLAICTSYILNFPLIWGILLGTIYASVSCAVVLPSVNEITSSSLTRRNWSQLICTAGGVDTTLSVGVYGLLFSYIFYPSSETYRTVKAVFTLFVGAILGIVWGTLSKYFPHKNDFYVAELRVLFVLFGGLFCNFFTSFIGWSGTGGVAVLACNMTAAHHWRQLGWPLNKNPASTAYRVLWAALEPILFAYTGTFFVIDSDRLTTLIDGFMILIICLLMRLIMTIIVCWDFHLKDKIFMCFTWTPKTIVEAVLCPVALTAVRANGTSGGHNMQHAEDIITLIVQSIIITTPVGFLLTHYLGPRLITVTTPKEVENGTAKRNVDIEDK